MLCSNGIQLHKVFGFRIPSNAGTIRFLSGFHHDASIQHRNCLKHAWNDTNRLSSCREQLVKWIWTDEMLVLNQATFDFNVARKLSSFISQSVKLKILHCSGSSNMQPFCAIIIIISFFGSHKGMYISCSENMRVMYIL